MENDKHKLFLIRLGITVAAVIGVMFFFKVLILDGMKSQGKWSSRSSSEFAPPVTVPITEAVDNIGKSIITEGTITKGHNSGKVVFLNFKDGLNLYLTCVIFASDFSKFPEKPEEYYMNKKVRVSGKVKEYKGAPEIVLSFANQIEILK